MLLLYTIFLFKVKKPTMLNFRLYGKIKNSKNITQLFCDICSFTSNQLQIKNKIIFDVNFVSKKAIQIINYKYRQINKPTNVISFANRDNNDLFVPLIGEIYICIAIAKQEAKKQHHSLHVQICLLFIHGLLHLLGFNHNNAIQKKKMFNLTDKIMQKCVLKG